MVPPNDLVFMRTQTRGSKIEESCGLTNRFVEDQGQHGLSEANFVPAVTLLCRIETTFRMCMGVPMKNHWGIDSPRHTTLTMTIH